MPFFDFLEINCIKLILVFINILLSNMAEKTAMPVGEPWADIISEDIDINDTTDTAAHAEDAAPAAAAPTDINIDINAEDDITKVHATTTDIDTTGEEFTDVAKKAKKPKSSKNAAAAAAAAPSKGKAAAAVAAAPPKGKAATSAARSKAMPYAVAAGAAGAAANDDVDDITKVAAQTGGAKKQEDTRATYADLAATAIDIEPTEETHDDSSKHYTFVKIPMIQTLNAKIPTKLKDFFDNVSDSQFIALFYVQDSGELRSKVMEYRPVRDTGCKMYRVGPNRARGQNVIAILFGASSHAAVLSNLKAFYKFTYGFNVSYSQVRALSELNGPNKILCINWDLTGKAPTEALELPDFDFDVISPVWVKSQV